MSNIHMDGGQIRSEVGGKNDISLFAKPVPNSLSLLVRFTVTFANVLTFLGGLIRCVSTFPGLEDSFNKDIQYWCAVAAQVLVGIANPLGFCLPTKVRSPNLFSSSKKWNKFCFLVNFDTKFA